MKIESIEIDDAVANLPFSIEGICCRSLTSFLCGIKFQEEDKRRLQAFVFGEEKALKIVSQAEEVVTYQGQDYPFGSIVFWNGSIIDEKSAAYRDLLIQVRNVLYGKEL